MFPVRPFLSMSLAALAALPATAAAQQQDSAVVPVTVGVAEPLPNISVDTVRSLDFGVIFRPHPNRGDCVYEVGSDGVSRTLPETRDGRSAAVAGCGFRDKQSPAPGRIKFSCVEGSSIAFQTRLTRNLGTDPILQQIPNLLVRDGANAVLGQIGTDGNVACPKGGSGFLDIGLHLIVPSRTELTSNSERYRFTITATVL